jgi:hypothetical protein
MSSGSIKRDLPARGEKLIVFTSLVGDGRQGPLFVVTKSKKVAQGTLTPREGHVTIVGKVERRGERTTMAFLEWALKVKLLQSSDLLLWDQEKSFKTEWVQHHLDSHNIQYMHFPAKSHALLNPCDNSYHSQFKRAYSRLITQHKPATIEERLKLLKDAYYSVSGESIQNMMDHNGITSGKPGVVVRRLFSEGLSPVPKYSDIHVKQVRTCLTWMKKHRYKEHDLQHLTEEDITSDSPHWTRYRLLKDNPDTE